MSDLKTFLSKPKTAQATTSAPQPQAESIKFEPLKENEKANFKRHYLTHGKTNKRCIRRERQLPSTFILPEQLRRSLTYSEKFNEKQRRYKNDVVDMETLKKPSPDVITSKNPQGWSRYILWTEIIACKNGFLYYTIPLIISLCIFIIQMALHDFWVNAVFSDIVLADFLTLRYIFKNMPKPVNKAILLFLLVGANVGAYALALQFPEWLAGLDVWFALRMLLIIYAVYHFGKFYVDFAIMYAHDQKIDFGNTVQIKAGKPRCGKTSSAVHDGIILAKMKWNELKFDYWNMVSREDEIIKRGDPHELMQLHELKISFSFYTMCPCIPCLWSNIGVFDKQGRAAHKVTIEHIKGLERLPLYSVVILDEIGAMLKADDGLNRKDTEKPLDVSDMFRLGGHFLKWVVIGCEQDFNHIFIDCRRVVGFNQVIQGQEWICKPTLALSLYNFLKFLKLDELDKKVKKNKKYSYFMNSFRKFVYSIGFRRVKYGYATNTQTDAGLTASNSDTELVRLDGTKYRLYPSNLAGDYDDRAYKQKYPSYFDKYIRGELHKHKHIEASDKNTSAFVNTTVLLEEKRKAQEEAINKIV